MSGIGKQIMPDGRIFEGQFKLGKLNGIGTIKFENGSTYFGEFVDNNMHGAGEMKMANGGYFIGQWKDNYPQGEGVLIKQGTYFQGDLTHAKMHKGILKWKYIWHNMCYSGEFSNDR